MDTILPPDADALRERGAALLRARRPREALALFDRAVALGADPLEVGGERWMAAMLLGDFPTAWEVSDLVLSRTAPDGFNDPGKLHHQRAVWDGKPFDGRRVLVRCYSGLGDDIQFCRYLPLLARRASGLVVQAPESRHELFTALPGVDAVFPLGDDVELPPFDVQAELMELAHAFRTSLETIPADVPYIRPDPARVAVQAARVERRERLAVGLAWAAGAWDGGHRTLPPEAVERLTEVPGIDWICLQRGPALADAGRLPFRDRGERTESLFDTAATIASLDLVISVDTSVAHLAGAMGAPVWTLLRYEADWRWMVEREDSPWYPTMRLFRQPEEGAWVAVADRVAETLAAFAR